MEIIKIYKDQNGTVFFESDAYCKELTEEEARRYKAEAKKKFEAGEFEEAFCDPDRCHEWYDKAGNFICGPIHVGDIHAGLNIFERSYLIKMEEAKKVQKAYSKFCKAFVGFDPFASR